MRGNGKSVISAGELFKYTSAPLSSPSMAWRSNFDMNLLTFGRALKFIQSSCDVTSKREFMIYMNNHQPLFIKMILVQDIY